MVAFYGTLIYERVIKENSDKCSGRKEHSEEGDVVESIGEKKYGCEERRHHGIDECVSNFFINHQAGHQSRYENK